MESKEAFEKRIKAELNELSEELAQLRLRTDMAKTEVKLEYTKRIIELKDKKEEAQKRLEELEETSGNGWKALEEGVERAVDDFSSSLEKAISELK